MPQPRKPAGTRVSRTGHMNLILGDECLAIVQALRERSKPAGGGEPAVTASDVVRTAILVLGGQHGIGPWSTEKKSG